MELTYNHAFVPTSGAQIMEEIDAEYARSLAKFGPQRCSTVFIALVEEVGEVAKALNEHEPVERLVEELVQVAAMAISTIQAIKRYNQSVGD